MCVDVFQCVAVKYVLSRCLTCVTVCCSVLQCVAVCCSVLQCVAVRYVPRRRFTCLNLAITYKRETKETLQRDLLIECCFFAHTQISIKPLQMSEKYTKRDVWTSKTCSKRDLLTMYLHTRRNPWRHYKGPRNMPKEVYRHQKRSKDIKRDV